MKRKKSSTTEFIHIKDNLYKCRKQSGQFDYYYKVKCLNCKKDIYRRRADIKKYQNHYCSNKCKTDYRIKNNLNKKYIIGKEYHVNENKIRIFNGHTWSYKTKCFCSNCKKTIYRENLTKNKNHFCSRKCKSLFFNTFIYNAMKNKEPNFYYLIGLIATDGCLSYNIKKEKIISAECRVSLKLNDDELLEKIQNIFGGKIKKYYNIQCPHVVWSLSNIDFIQYLVNVGIVKNKSLVLNMSNFFNQLTSKNKWFFLRGCWDGDGYVGLYKGKYASTGICSGSKTFMKMISDFINDEFSWNNKIYTTHNKNSKNPMYSISFSHKKAITILDQLYNNVKDTLFLQRKYNTALKFINSKKVKPGSAFFKSHLSYDYPISEQKKELQKIKQTNGNFNAVINLNKIVLSHQPHFFEIEKQMWLKNEDNLRKRLITNRKKYINKDEFTLTDKEILRGFKISGIHYSYSHFNPLWIKKFIEDYKIESIYDPCGGWGHRLLGAYNIKYIYNDWDVRSYNGCIKITKDFNIKNKIFYNNNSSEFTPQDEYQAVFTCPPYYNIEVYNNKRFKTLEDYQEWWNKTIKCCIKSKVIYFAYVINSLYLDLTKDICKQNNLCWLRDISLGSRYSHFKSNTSKNKKEVLTIFST